MKLLAIETTQGVGSVTIADEAGLRETVLLPNNAPCESLMTTIVAMLGRHDWTLGMIDAIACTIGPGSFTSLRIGLATAKGIAFSTGAKIRGISSLRLLAANGDGQRSVLALIRAQRGSVFGAVYSPTGERKTTESIMMTDECLGMIRGMSEPVLVVGSGVLHNPSLQTITMNHVEVPPLDDDRHLLNGRHLATLAMRDFQQDVVDDLIQLAPHYIQQPWALSAK